MKPFSLSVHIFRRDLRLDDNTALIAALEQSAAVVPIFIFDERQLTNPYKGNNSFAFMLNSLKELNEDLQQKGSRLHTFNGLAHKVMNELFTVMKIDAVFVNRDYTPFSIKRDNEIAEVCNQHNVSFFSYADALLNEPEQVAKPDGKPYTIFTPYMRKARLNVVQKPKQNNLSNYFTGDFDNQNVEVLPTHFSQNYNPNLLLKGGRNEGLHLLEHVGSMVNYDTERNLPAVKGTTMLSAHHKFGTVSIRETYYHISNELSSEHTLLNELYWRDFFTHIAFHFPKVFGNAFNEKYVQIQWENNEEKFTRWCNGTTGFPIVDAGMRELIATGFMHNRVRMIVASFLTKDLHIDWRLGERFFANHLIDYDPAVNNGNWQWAASTGCDAQPYFRIFNPWSQQLKFDAQCIYIKNWIPELRLHTPKQIHGLAASTLTLKQYPQPIVDHSLEAKIAIEMFRN